MSFLFAVFLMVVQRKDEKQTDRGGYGCLTDVYVSCQPYERGCDMKKNLLSAIFAAAAAILLAGCGATNDADEIISNVKQYKMPGGDSKRTFGQALSSNLNDLRWKCFLEGDRYFVMVSGQWARDTLIDDEHNIIVSPGDDVTANLEYRDFFGLFCDVKFHWGYTSSIGYVGRLFPPKDVKFKGGFLGVLCH